MTAPRTIWMMAEEASGIAYKASESEDCYHHDDVVREPREELKAALSDCMGEDGEVASQPSLHWIWDARAILAKMPA